jgi:predicted dehydrogenase
MEKRVRIGIIGTYRANVFIKPIENRDDAVIAAVCGRTIESARQTAEEFGIDAYYDSYERMIDEAGLDALIVGAPDDLHLPMTLAGLRSGLHVLCEKPLAMNAADAGQMLAAARAAKVKHMTHFNVSNFPQIRFVGRLLAEECIGSWHDFHIHWISDKYLVGKPKEWRLDPTRSNGVLGDFGSHAFNLIETHLSPVISISTSLMARPVVGGGEIPNESLAAQLKLANGAHGSLLLTKLANVEMQIGIDMYGEGGSLSVRLDKNAKKILLSEGTDKQLHALTVPDDVTALPDIVNLFVTSIHEDREFAPTFADGLRTQKLMDAAIESNKTGRVIAV